MLPTQVITNFTNSPTQRIKTSHSEKTTALLSHVPPALRGKHQPLFLHGPSHRNTSAHWAERKEKELKGLKSRWSF